MEKAAMTPRDFHQYIHEFGIVHMVIPEVIQSKGGETCWYIEKKIREKQIR